MCRHISKWQFQHTLTSETGIRRGLPGGVCMPPAACTDDRSRSVRAAKSRQRVEAALPSQEHTLIGFSCRDCTSKKIFSTLDALLTHCGIALRNGWHQSNPALGATWPVSRGHRAYGEQHVGNLWAVANLRPQSGIRDNPSTRIFIQLNGSGEPLVLEMRCLHEAD
jgi:hypothetical protein